MIGLALLLSLSCLALRAAEVSPSAPPSSPAPEQLTELDDVLWSVAQSLPANRRRSLAGCNGLSGSSPTKAMLIWPEVQACNGKLVPGEVSVLNPAMILYGFDPDELGICYMLVDSRGMAEPALGLVFGNTLVSRQACANQSGNCESNSSGTIVLGSSPIGVTPAAIAM